MALENCKVTYFSWPPGRGEPIRLALIIGGIKFTDERLTEEEWPAVKPTTPWGTLPVLTLSCGAKIGQTRAALRYVGIKVGLYPSDTFQAALVESMIDALEDIISKVDSLGANLLGENKVLAYAEALAKGGAIYVMYEKVEHFIEEHGLGGHCVGSTLTIADLFLFIVSGHVVGGYYDGVPNNALDVPFPHVLGTRKNVRKHAAVNKWYLDLEKSFTVPCSFGPFN